MTYNVFSGTLNLTQSSSQTRCIIGRCSSYCLHVCIVYNDDTDVWTSSAQYWVYLT